MDLSSFKRRKPDAARFFDHVENSYKNAMSEKVTKVVTDTPYPTHLNHTGCNFLPFSRVIIQDSISEHLNTHYNYLKSFKKVDLHVYADVFFNEYPDVRYHLQKQVSDPELFFEQMTVQNLHMFHNAPIVSTTEPLYRMMKRTAMGSVKNIPANFLRAPYDISYFDYSNIELNERPKLRQENGEEFEVDGVYVTQQIFDPKEVHIRKWIENEPSMRRAAELGTISFQRNIVSLSFQFVARSKGSNPEYNFMSFSFAFSEMEEGDDELTVLDVMTTHQDQGDLAQLAVEDQDVFNVGMLSEPLELIINQMLYMMVSPDDRKEIKESTELELQIKRSKNPKKVKRLRKQLAASKDVLRIGQQYLLSTERSQGSQSGSKQSREPQLRKCHWKMVAYGEGRTKRKPKFIAMYRTGNKGDMSQKKVKLQ